MLAPFRVRGFRFQWAGDLAMSWAVEMEVLILGWFVLVESGSVSLLAVFGALHYIGSLISPIFGVAGDRIGYAKLFWMTRAFYALLAGILLLLAWQDALTPVAVLVVALLAGIVRPSDMVMRYAVNRGPWDCKDHIGFCTYCGGTCGRFNGCGFWHGLGLCRDCGSLLHELYLDQTNSF
jgi:hypothetical protein